MIDEEHALNKSSQNRSQTVFIILLDFYGWLTPFINERESEILSQANLPRHSFLQPGSWLTLTARQCPPKIYIFNMEISTVYLCIQSRVAAIRNILCCYYPHYKLRNVMYLTHWRSRAP